MGHPVRLEVTSNNLQTIRQSKVQEFSVYRFAGEIYIYIYKEKKREREREEQTSTEKTLVYRNEDIRLFNYFISQI